MGKMEKMEAQEILKVKKNWRLEKYGKWKKVVGEMGTNVRKDELNK